MPSAFEKEEGNVYIKVSSYLLAWCYWN